MHIATKEQPTQIHIPSLFQPSSSAIPVIDPKLKHLGRVWINMKHVQHSTAVERWLCRHPHPPSLCMLHQSGRCNAGVKCNQTHVHSAHMTAVRETLLALPFNNCCYAHGDVASRREDFRAMVMRHVIELRKEGCQPIRVHPTWIAVTTYWDRFLKAERTSGKNQGDRVFRWLFARLSSPHYSPINVGLGNAADASPANRIGPSTKH